MRAVGPIRAALPRLGVLGVVAVATSALAAPVGAARVAVVVRPEAAVTRLAERGAAGLVVPGAGPTVSRAGALAALVRGRVVSSDIASRPGGRPVISLSRRPADVTIYVSLPPPGTWHNTRRYPIAVVGAGYHGLLVSKSTRVPGLVSIADVAPTALALERGRPAPLGWRADTHASAELRRLDRRLDAVHGERNWVTVALVGLLAVFLVPALVRRSTRAARAALLTGPALISVALVFSALDLGGPLATLPLAACGAGLALAGSSPRLFTPLVVLFLAVFLVVLAGRPEVNALAALGPHPDGGVRFYGVTNEVETLVLAPVVAVVAASGAGIAVPTAVLALVTIGWSRVGADGGGLVVYALAFLVILAARSHFGRRSWLGVASLAGAACALALIAVALDAATGGSSHVTRAVGGGPGTLAGDLADRLRISWAGATSSPHAVALMVLSLATLFWLAAQRPATTAVTAYLCATALSLLVNDTPVDVAGFAALSCLALWALERSYAKEAQPAVQRSGGRPASVESARAASTTKTRSTTPGRAAFRRIIPSAWRSRHPVETRQ